MATRVGARATTTTRAVSTSARRLSSARRASRDVSRAAAKARRGKGKGKGNGGDPGRATDLEPATLMDVEENHALEQFFYDDETLRRLMTVAKRYERPLFMCNPSLASAWERDVGTEYLLLDCDLRFKKLMKHFRAFDLRRPFQVRFKYDVVFVDPPFANVSPQEVKRAVDLIAVDESQKSVPVYIAYNADREEALLEAFDESARMGRALGYKSVKADMQARIFLYGPKV